MDRVSSDKRSQIMKKIKSKDTKPELVVRKLVFSMGYRYRLHVKSLPGKPDIVFTASRKIIFVNGCFWHMHEGCKKGSVPKAPGNFWTDKLRNNKDRDKHTEAELRKLGWDQMVVWQCELKDIELLRSKIRDFLGPRKFELNNKMDK